MPENCFLANLWVSFFELYLLSFELFSKQNRQAVVYIADVFCFWPVINAMENTCTCKCNCQVNPLSCLKNVCTFICSYSSYKTIFASVKLFLNWAKTGYSTATPQEFVQFFKSLRHVSKIPFFFILFIILFASHDKLSLFRKKFLPVLLSSLYFSYSPRKIWALFFYPAMSTSNREWMCLCVIASFWNMVFVISSIKNTVKDPAKSSFLVNIAMDGGSQLVCNGVKISFWLLINPLTQFFCPL